MLSKKTTITYSINTGNIMFDDKIVLMDGENVGILALKGELDTTVKATLIIQPFEGEKITVPGTICPYKGISREFALINKGSGKYKAQLVLTQGTGINKSINKSQIFEYEVLPSL